ncbi:MAG TPA: hypothetical protein DCZ04_15510 [Syntrophorhabdus aromaticivorans]|nr:hypothetical protein [Syntrophorhabdus aromaticivorans]
MKTTINRTILAVLSAVFTVILLSNGNAYAHCDTLDGPVVAEARAALASGDVTPLLKWVSAEEEESIKTAFKHTLAVRKLGGEAKQLADMYFFETLVRIHRAGEGAPYTGLKPGAAIDPAVALADKAIESGSVDKLANVLTQALDKGIRERFERVMKTRQHADESVAVGREFVEAYVQFTHYAEGIHGLVKKGASHHEHP